MLSIIVPTRNRASYLKDCLDSFLKQSINPSYFEVLIIDNGSTDNTSEVFKNFKKTSLNIKYFYEAKLGLHYARHRGLKESKYEILVFCDDDIIATDFWIETISNMFIDNDLAILGGNCLPIFESSIPDWLDEMWKIKGQDGSQEIPALSICKRNNGIYDINPSNIYGCNFSIKKSILLKAGGFNPDGMPNSRKFFRGNGETAVAKFIWNKKLKSVFNSDATIYHRVSKERMTLDYFRERGYKEAFSVSFSDIKNNKFIFKTRIREIYCSKFLNMIKRMVRVLFNKKNSNQLNNATFCYQDGYRKGLCDYRKEYLRNKSLRIWVDQKNYLSF